MANLDRDYYNTQKYVKRLKRWVKYQQTQKTK